MDKNLEYEPVRGAHILMIVNPVSGRISGEHVADKLEAWLKENGWSVNGLPIATMSNALKATPSEAVQGGKPETATKSDADKATGSNADNITAKNIPGLGGSNR